MPFPETLTRVGTPPKREPRPRAEKPAGRASAGKWCPASRRLAAKYQREGNKAKLAHLMKILHERGSRDGDAQA